MCHLISLCSLLSDLGSLLSDLGSRCAQDLDSRLASCRSRSKVVWNWILVIVLGLLLAYVMLQLVMYLSGRKRSKYHALSNTEEGQQLADFTRERSEENLASYEIETRVPIRASELQTPRQRETDDSRDKVQSVDSPVQNRQSRSPLP